MCVSASKEKREEGGGVLLIRDLSHAPIPNKENLLEMKPAVAQTQVPTNIRIKKTM
jgi:hypothetical protein